MRKQRVPGQPLLPHRSRQDTPASKATSDTDISPSETLIGHKRKAWSSKSTYDLLIRNVASKKPKLTNPPPPLLPLSSLLSAAQLDAGRAPAPVTFQTPLQRHTQRVKEMMEKEMREKFMGKSSPVKPRPVKRQPLSLIAKPSMPFNPPPVPTKHELNTSPMKPLPPKSFTDLCADYDSEELEDMDMEHEDEDAVPMSLAHTASQKPFL